MNSQMYFVYMEFPNIFCVHRICDQKVLEASGLEDA